MTRRVATFSGMTPSPTDTTTAAPFIDAAGFTTLVEQGRGLALVDFTADHCPPCRVLAPQVDALARELAGRVTVAKVDVDHHPLFDHYEAPSCHPSKTILYRPIADAAANLFAFYRVGTHLTGRGGNQLFCGDGFPLTQPRWRRWFQRSKMPLWLAPGFVDQVRASEQDPWRAGPRLYDNPARERQYRSILRTANVARFIRVADERQPLLYRPLVEFALALPWEHLLRPDQDRVIQRRSLRGILPERIRLRASKGRNTSSLLLRGLRESWPKLQPLTVGRRLAQLDLVQPQPFQAACERLRHGLVADQLMNVPAAPQQFA